MCLKMPTLKSVSFVIIKVERKMKMYDEVLVHKYKGYDGEYHDFTTEFVSFQDLPLLVAGLL